MTPTSSYKKIENSKKYQLVLRHISLHTMSAVIPQLTALNLLRVWSLTSNRKSKLRKTFVVYPGSDLCLCAPTCLILDTVYLDHCACFRLGDYYRELAENKEHRLQHVLSAWALLAKNWPWEIRNLVAAHVLLLDYEHHKTYPAQRCSLTLATNLLLDL
jgi:hypothetical protein